MIVISIIFAILSGLFYGEKETIIAKILQLHVKDTWASKKWFPKFLAKWWEANNWYYSNPISQFVMRYILAPFKDGYHFCGSASVMLGIFSAIYSEPLFLLVSELSYPPIVSYVATALILFVIHAVAAQTSYHDWLKEL